MSGIAREPVGQPAARRHADRAGAVWCLMMGRAAAWSIAAIPAGMGQGIALRERKVILNGVVGARARRTGRRPAVRPDQLRPDVRRRPGNLQPRRRLRHRSAAFVGLFVGLVEGWTKTAWLLMQNGPLAGKQFILFRDTTVLGSSPKADVYLFKDDAIEPRHALDHQSRRPLRNRRLQHARRHLRQRHSRHAQRAPATATRSCWARPCWSSR